MTLTDFLLARIAEDEAIARETYAVSPWHAAGYCVMNHTVITETDEESTTAHMARWHPARVLAECEAKRRIVELHTAKHPDYDSERACVTCQWDVDCDAPAVNAEYPCTTLRLLALPYADHPDYRKEWRP